MPPYRACLVDVFDTVVSIDMVRYNAALAERAGIEPDAFAAALRPRAMPAMDGSASMRETLAEVLRACGVMDDAGLLDRLVAADGEVVEELAVLHDDAVPFLESLRERGVRTAFVSNCAENTRPLLDRLGLSVLVDELVLSCEVRVAKPDPAIFETAVERLGVSADESLFVDDQLVFCRAAETLGIRAVQISRTGGPGDVSTLSELVEYF